MSAKGTTWRKIIKKRRPSEPMPEYGIKLMDSLKGEIEARQKEIERLKSKIKKMKERGEYDGFK